MADELYRAATSANTASFVCEHCCQPHKRKLGGCSLRNGYVNRWCSMQCRTAAAAMAKQGPVCRIWTGHCIACAKSFVSSTSTKTCSGACYALIRKAKHLDSARAQHRQKARVVVCAECEASFSPLHGSSNATLCMCCVAVRVRADKLARKMRIRVQSVEAVNPLKVFDRDGWICQHCKVKTPRALRGTFDDRAPELDHIIPLSLGGDHSYLNTQCMCRSCNQRKGNRPLGQLLLVG